MQSILENMETLIARQESVFQFLDESNNLDSLLAEITDITTSKHDYVIMQLTGKVMRILNGIIDEEPDAKYGLIGQIADTIYPYISVKPTPDPEQYGDYSVTIKNVRTEVIQVLGDFGLEQVKNPQTNTDVEHSELFDRILNDICSIQIPLWDSC